MEQKVFFYNSKGDRLCGILSNPTNNVHNPIIIIVHGFASNKDRITYKTFENLLNKHDLSSLRIDLFGNGDSEGNFEELTVSEATDDIVQAVNFVKKLGFNKIGLIGSSFGGTASLCTFSKITNICVLGLISPVSNYEEAYRIKIGDKGMNNWRQKGHRIYTNRFGKKLKINYSFIKDLNKYNIYTISQNISTPTIIVQGEKDEFVPLNQTIKLSKNIPNCELFIIKGSNHNYTNAAHFKKMITYISEFIVQHS